MALTAEQGNTFDYLCKYSYLFRLQIESNGLGIATKSIGGTDAYFVIYREHVIGVLSIGETYVNFSLYKYLKKLFPKLADFRMSEYFDADMTKFLFDKFRDYVTSIKLALDTLPDTAPGNGTINEVVESIDDVKARLIEFLVSDDITDAFLDGDSLPVNVLRHDISVLMGEVTRLENERKRKSEELIRLFLRS